MKYLENITISKKQIIWIILVVLFLSVGGVLLYDAELSKTNYLTLLWIAAVAILLLFGNRLITAILNRNFTWLKYGTFRFVLHLFLGIIFSLIIINVAYFLFKYILTEEPPVMSQIIVTNVYGTAIFIPLFSIYFSLYFLRHWRIALMAKEEAEKGKIKAQLVTLKDHLDPHFLFNNLNILSSLIEIDTERSQKFLSEFADVYRAILLAKDEDLITLQEELKFIESYVYLIETRFRDDIKFTFNVDERFNSYLIPPLSIQMLIENVVKHNKITINQPLEIDVITIPEGFLVVKNKLNKQDLSKIKSSGSGINNLRGRYAPFSEQKVKVIETETHFEVVLPLLKESKST